MEPWVLYIKTAIKVGSLLIQGGQEIAPFAQQLWETLRAGKDQPKPTVEQWARLREMEKRLEDELQAPLEDPS